MSARLPVMSFGGDYNPEQWSAEVHAEDVRLMQEAGVNLVTVGVFSWAWLEPEPGRFEFGWLDTVLDRLHAGGIRVDLATATASPPPWLTAQHPEILPVTADGRTLWPGGRQSYCPSSPVFMEHALRLCTAMAERYAGHDALALWHVSNELGCHNALCYCDVSAEAFRRWLGDRYGDIGRLNDAWGTAFWSQRYTDFSQILPPRVAPAFPNPTQQLDFHRFSSDQLLANYRAERDVLHRLSPGVPVTTNLMVMEHTRNMDYLGWGPELDLVTNDHYKMADPEAHRELAFSSDLVRGVSSGRPWLLMETSPSAVNWQPRNIAKRPGELLRASMQHVARGSDGILVFQFRASRAGAEKFHSGLVPHAGTDTRLWREVVQLGAALQAVGEVAGSSSDNRTAILFDWNARWACELDSHPSIDVRYLDRAMAFHAALTDRGIGVDVVHAEADLTPYSLVIVPTLYLASAAAAASIAAAAARGATVLVTYFSGIVDEDDHIRLGGYPGAFRELLGVRVEEFLPLREGERVTLDDGTTADVWAEHLELTGATAVVRHQDGPAAGMAAVTRRDVGDGAAWYVATRTDPVGTAALVDALLAESGVAPVAATEPGVEVVRRRAEDGRSWVFAINHTDEAAVLPLHGHDLLTDSPTAAEGLHLDGGAVAVVRGGVMLAVQRRARVIAELERRGIVKVSELVSLLGVSDMTIRRDLTALERQGMLHKVHGGAVLYAEPSTSEPGFEAKSGRRLAEKEAIAVRAASLVAPGSAIAISAGTTTHLFARHLVDIPGLTVVTNSVWVADILHRAGSESLNVLLTGGLRTPSDALVGPIAIAALRSLHLDAVFMGVHGMDLYAGFSTPNLLEAETNRAMVRSARRLIVLADSTKWGVVGLSSMAELNEASLVITDTGLAPAAVSELSEQVEELVLVEPSTSLPHVTLNPA